MSGLTVALKGQQSGKIVEGKKTIVVPFFGDNSGSFGVGFLVSGQPWAYLNGPVFPKAIIQSWRGMKIFEKLDRIERETLHYCWQAGSEDAEEKYLKKLAEQFHGREIFDKIREEIFLVGPSLEELDSVIQSLRNGSVDLSYSGGELEREAEKGRIPLTEEVQRIIYETKQRQDRSKWELEECDKSLPREESLSWFFYDLGIGNFIFGFNEWGKERTVYGWEYGHRELKNLDRDAKWDSFNKRSFPYGHMLLHSKQGPDVFYSNCIMRARIDCRRDQIGSPSLFDAVSKRTYAFLFADYRDGRFFY